jgi:hypothetical protein
MREDGVDACAERGAQAGLLGLQVEKLDHFDS